MPSHAATHNASANKANFALCRVGAVFWGVCHDRIFKEEVLGGTIRLIRTAVGDENDEKVILDWSAKNLWDNSSWWS